MALANQTAEQILRTVNLLSTKPSSYVVVEDNKIYVTVPLPDYHLPGNIFQMAKKCLNDIIGYSKSVVDTISEADIEGNFWQAVAALNPSKRIVSFSRNSVIVNLEI